MPSQSQHLHQARHNLAVIDTLLRAEGGFADWVATAAFYSALHLVESWLATRGVHSGSHTERDDWVIRAKELRRVVWPRYKELSFQSRQARYQCVQIDKADLEGRLLPYLADIEREIASLRASSAG